MNGALRNALTNPWLASLVSFLPVIAFLGVVLLCLPNPFPTVQGISAMPWWAPLGGLIGAVAVVVGLLFVNQVGAGTLAGLTITANILLSLNNDDEVVGMVSSTQQNAQGMVFAVRSKNIFQALDAMRSDSTLQTSDSTLSHLKIPTNTFIKGMDRKLQVKRLEDYIFIVKSN